MTNERNLDWQGCYNVRDLGGLPLADGGQTRWGSIIRADVLGRLTEAGKQAALESLPFVALNTAFLDQGAVELDDSNERIVGAKALFDHHLLGAHAT